MALFIGLFYSRYRSKLYPCETTNLGKEIDCHNLTMIIQI